MMRGSETIRSLGLMMPVSRDLFSVKRMTEEEVIYIEEESHHHKRRREPRMTGEALLAAILFPTWKLSHLKKLGCCSWRRLRHFTLMKRSCNVLVPQHITLYLVKIARSKTKPNCM